MLGLERGTVRLEPHREEWQREAERTIALLRGILGETALDIQHVGSTAILGICAKPILDLAVGLKELGQIEPYREALAAQGVLFRGQDIADQLLFVMGDFQQNTRTHHIHVVRWGSDSWQNYLNFRDYLNAFPEQAKEYEACKRQLACRFPDDRNAYTQGKQQMIDTLLTEARLWRNGQDI